VSCVNLCRSPRQEVDNHVMNKYKMVINLHEKSSWVGPVIAQHLLTRHLRVTAVVCREYVV